MTGSRPVVPRFAGAESRQAISATDNLCLGRSARCIDHVSQRMNTLPNIFPDQGQVGRDGHLFFVTHFDQLVLCGSPANLKCLRTCFEEASFSVYEPVHSDDA